MVCCTFSSYLWNARPLAHTHSGVKAHRDITLYLQHLKSNCLCSSACEWVCLCACSQVLCLGCSEAQKWNKWNRISFHQLRGEVFQRCSASRLFSENLLFTGTHLFSHPILLSPCSVQLHAGKKKGKRKEKAVYYSVWQAAVTSLSFLVRLHYRKRRIIGNVCYVNISPTAVRSFFCRVFLYCHSSGLGVSAWPCHCHTDAAQRCLQINNVVIISIATIQILMSAQRD